MRVAISLHDCCADLPAIGWKMPGHVTLDEVSATCGHCGVVVYPEAFVLADHTITCDNGAAVWWSNALRIEVHRCNQPAIERAEVMLLELTSDLFSSV